MTNYSQGIKLDDDRIREILDKAVEVGLLLRQLRGGRDALCALEYARLALTQRALEAGLTDEQLAEVRQMAADLFEAGK